MGTERTYGLTAAGPFPVLVHGDGLAIWGNRAFVDRFGIDPAVVKPLKARELLWRIGIRDPLAGMIAGGATFPLLEAPPVDKAFGMTTLRQIAVPGVEGRPGHLILTFTDIHLR